MVCEQIKIVFIFRFEKRCKERAVNKIALYTYPLSKSLSMHRKFLKFMNQVRLLATFPKFAHI